MKALNCDEQKTCRKALDNLLRPMYDMKHRGDGVTKIFLHVSLYFYLLIPKRQGRRKVLSGICGVFFWRLCLFRSSPALSPTALRR